MRGLSEIAAKNLTLANQIQERGGYLLDTMIPELIAIDRLIAFLCDNPGMMEKIQEFIVEEMTDEWQECLYGALPYVGHYHTSNQRLKVTNRLVLIVAKNTIWSKFQTTIKLLALANLAVWSGLLCPKNY